MRACYMRSVNIIHYMQPSVEEKEFHERRYSRGSSERGAWPLVNISGPVATKPVLLVSNRALRAQSSSPTLHSSDNRDRPKRTHMQVGADALLARSLRRLGSQDVFLYLRAVDYVGRNILEARLHTLPASPDTIAGLIANWETFKNKPRELMIFRRLGI